MNDLDIIKDSLSHYKTNCDITDGIEMYMITYKTKRDLLVIDCVLDFLCIKNLICGIMEVDKIILIKKR